MLKTRKKTRKTIRTLPIWQQFVRQIGLSRFRMGFSRVISRWREFLGQFAATRLRTRTAARSLVPRFPMIEPLEMRMLLSTAPLPAAHSLSPALYGNAVLIAQPIPAVDISQGTTAKVVPLFTYFEEGGVPSPDLQYQAAADSNPSLFAAAPQIVAPGLLLLRVSPDVLGSTTLTIQATDQSGRSADTTLVVNVSAGDAGSSSDTAGASQGESLGTSGRDVSGADSDPALGSGATITTLAGNGVWGYSGDGGLATSASLSALGIAVDAAGDVFIADEGHDVVREVNVSTGLITTVAGNGTWGYSGDGGLATNAQLCYPMGVAVDTAGDLFIADTCNDVVREVDLATGVITTVAGGGTDSDTAYGGPATIAQLYYP